MYVSPIMNFNNSAYNAQIKRAKSKGINIENRIDNNRVENYYATAPSFKMSEYKAATKAAVAAFTAALAAYGIKVAQNTEPEEEMPSYEEFEKMLNDDINISGDNKEHLCRKFKEDPQNAWALYNFKDENGYRYYWLDNARYKTVYPEIAKILLNIQNDNGCKLFNLNKAADLSPEAAEYPIGFAAMLSVQDEYGQKRFEPYDFSYAKDFEINPQKAIEMATAKNELGNYKYELDEIIEDRQEITDDDRILEIIANIRRPDGKRTKLIFVDKAVINAYKKYPEEVTKLLQLSTSEDNTINRFDLCHIDEKVVRFFKEAPTTFMTLANSLYRSLGINLKAIEKIMEAMCYDKQNDTIHEIDDKTLSDIIMLDYVIFNRTHNCNTTENIINREGAETFIKILEAYRKYPDEFMYITKHYNNAYACTMAPTEDDIQLFINNRAKFDKIYKKCH